MGNTFGVPGVELRLFCGFSSSRVGIFSLFFPASRLLVPTPRVVDGAVSRRRCAVLPGVWGIVVEGRRSARRSRLGLVQRGLQIGRSREGLAANVITQANAFRSGLAERAVELLQGHRSKQMMSCALRFAWRRGVELGGVYPAGSAGTGQTARQERKAPALCIGPQRKMHQSEL